jgi:hypothetical protein
MQMQDLSVRRKELMANNGPDTTKNKPIRAGLAIYVKCQVTDVHIYSVEQGPATPAPSQTMCRAMPFLPLHITPKQYNVAENPRLKFAIETAGVKASLKLRRHAHRARTNDIFKQREVPAKLSSLLFETIFGCDYCHEAYLYLCLFITDQLALAAESTPRQTKPRLF